VKIGKKRYFPFFPVQKLGRKKHDLCYFPYCKYLEKNREIRKEKNMIYVIFFRGKIGKKKTLIYKEIFSSLLAQVTGGSSRA